MPQFSRASIVLMALSYAAGCGADGDDTTRNAAPDTTPSTTPPAQTRVASNDPGAPEMVDLTVQSAAMKRDVQVRVLLPRAFDAMPARRWPVLYLLHGANEPLGYKAWTEQTTVETLAQTKDLLVVMPEGGQAGWYSDWVGECEPGAARVDNQPSWETFHVVELPKLLKEHFRANDQAAIAGLSMGGFGALSYAARHPGMYLAAASYSGGLHTSAHALVATISLAQAGCSNTDAIWGNVDTHGAVWAAHDPYALADKLLGLPLYVSSGNGGAGPLDAPGTSDPLESLAEAANREFTERIAQLGSSNLVTSYYGAGTHSWPYWARELTSSFALLTDPLTAH